jgi:hypothetical protein
VSDLSFFEELPHSYYATLPALLQGDYRKIFMSFAEFPHFQLQAIQAELSIPGEKKYEQTDNFFYLFPKGRQ